MSRMCVVWYFSHLRSFFIAHLRAIKFEINCFGKTTTTKHLHNKFNIKWSFEEDYFITANYKEGREKGGKGTVTL